MKKVRLGALAAALLAALPAGAQAPAGPEFRINDYTTGNQVRPDVSVAADGGFVAVWNDYGRDGSLSGVFAQRFDSAARPVGASFQVNSSTTGFQAPASVAVAPSGAFVVVWTHYVNGETADVRGQRFAADGGRLGGEFRIDDSLPGYQVGAVVAGDDAGRFVVAWRQAGSHVRARRFDADGAPLGASFLAHTTNAIHDMVEIGSSPAGDFVVVWASKFQDGYEFGVYGQRFDSAGGPLGGEFRVNAYTSDSERDPSVGFDAAGNFVVAWTELRYTQYRADVAARRFDADGQPLGPDFIVNTTTGVRSYGHPAARPDGSFVVVWVAYQSDGRFQLAGRAYDASGEPLGDEMQVNAATTGDHFAPAVAADGAGRFVVAWTAEDTSSYEQDVVGRRFGGLDAAGLAVDTQGNGVWEPGETAALEPSWRNGTGAAQGFDGRLARLTGPAGPTYAITDGHARYEVPAGTTASCGDCYGISIDLGPRPVLHWDAAADEVVTGASFVQPRSWRLHVGGSFTDVPTTSLFYRFVETLLHHGVTAGCGGGAYCPPVAATREQMAPFVLVAKEGEGYAPPKCTDPVFGDVPASSPFCPFVEELWRRGVVSGCGGGDYCPTAAVTREQMSVFVLRTLDPALAPPPCATPVFGDVPASSPFCRWIEELFRRGVVAGCGGGNYCPQQAVTREQMSVFLTATFGLTLYGP